MAVLGAILLAVIVSVDPASGVISVKSEHDPVGDVLASLRRATGIEMIVDSSAERRLVTLDERFPTAQEAVRGIASRAGLEVEQKESAFLVRKPRPPAPPPPKIESDGGGRYRAPEKLSYPVVVLRDRPEDVTARAALAGFEARPGVSLVVHEQLKERAIREYLEGRDAFRVMLALSSVEVDLRGDVTVRNARVYVDAAKKRFYDELLFSTGGEVAHFVFVLDAETQACQTLYIFKAKK